MRLFTIAERLTGAVLLPLAAMLVVPYLAAALVPSIGETNALYAHVAIGLGAAALAGAAVLSIARGIVRPLAEAADTLTPSPMPNFIPPRHCRRTVVKLPV